MKNYPKISFDKSSGFNKQAAYSNPPKDTDVPPEIRTEVRSKIFRRKFLTSAENFSIVGCGTKGSPLPTIRTEVRSKKKDRQ